MPPVERIAEALEGRQAGDGWLCRCPCHEDQHRSLSVANGTKGQAIVVKCHAGCLQEAVIAELKARDLWPDNVSPDFSPVVWKKAVPRGIICSGSTGLCR
jgi:hypothetical protein